MDIYIHEYYRMPAVDIREMLGHQICELEMLESMFDSGFHLESSLLAEAHAYIDAQHTDSGHPISNKLEFTLDLTNHVSSVNHH